MRDLLLIYRAIELIEARLQDEVTVSDMAEAAGYSLYHFIRLFNQVVWHTPYDYLMRRRLSEAACELVHSDRRVVDIASDYQFKSHETFSRAFKRFFGVQPVQWRERGVIPRQALMPALSLSYLEHIQRPGFDRPMRVTMHQRCLAGWMTKLNHPPEAVVQLWRDLEQGEYFRRLKAQSPNFFGVTSYLDEAGELGFYMAACEVDPLDAAGPVCVSCSLPAGDYIYMTHPAPLAALSLTLTFLYHTWLPKAGLRPAHPLEIVDFGAAPPWPKPPGKIMLWLPVKNQAAGIGEPKYKEGLPA